MMEVSLNVPLGEQPHLQEMFAMMEENRMDAQAQNLEDFLQYFNQITGLTALFKEVEFGRAWKAIENDLQDEWEEVEK